MADWMRAAAAEIDLAGGQIGGQIYDAILDICIPSKSGAGPGHTLDIGKCERCRGLICKCMIHDGHCELCPPKRHYRVYGKKLEKQKSENKSFTHKRKPTREI